MIVALILGGCGGHDVYRGETFKADSPYQRTFSLPAAKACEGARLALLSQGYQLVHDEPLALQGKKLFQPSKDASVTMEFNVLCKEGAGSAIVFANAVETKEELKKTSQSTSLSLPSVGSISMPWGKSTESLIKVGAETVADPAFYSRFFELVATYLGQPKLGQPKK
jgi:hypothetical protein